DPVRAKRARQIGLSLAFIFRVVMLAALTWLMGLSEPILTVFGADISWRDIILIAGGLFLIAKATHEMHGEVEAEEHGGSAATKAANAAFSLIILQLIVIDLVFSVDS